MQKEEMFSGSLRALYVSRRDKLHAKHLEKTHLEKGYIFFFPCPPHAA